MILSKDINPEYSLYNVGANILEVLIDTGKEISFKNLYLSVSDKYKMASDLFSMGLDWLYLLGAIEPTEKGLIKCT